MSPADIRDKARMHPLTTVFQHYTESPSQYNKETKVKKIKKYIDWEGRYKIVVI